MGEFQNILSPVTVGMICMSTVKDLYLNRCMLVLEELSGCRLPETCVRDKHGHKTYLGKKQYASKPLSSHFGLDLGSRFKVKKSKFCY